MYDNVKFIEEQLDKYDVILIFLNYGPQICEVYELFIRSEVLKNSDKRVLVTAFSDDKTVVNCVYKENNMREYECILDLYNMYEFSNRVQIVSECSQYGSMMNYVNLGIISMDEMFEAWLR